MPWKWKFGDTKHPSLGLALRIIEFTGLLPNARTPVTNVLYTFGRIYATIFLLNMYLYLFINFNYKLFIIFVQYSAFQLSIVKAATFSHFHEKWTEIIETISQIDRESVVDGKSDDVAIVMRYRRYCRLIVIVIWATYTVVNIFFMALYWPMNVVYFSQLERSDLINLNLFNVWLPVDEMTRFGRFVSVFLQTMFLEVAAAQVLTWDTTVLSCMIFFAGQLKALRKRCAFALDNPHERKCLQNIVKCHQHYLKILKCQKLFKSFISPIMFIYYIMITINYGVCMMLLMTNQDDMAQLSLPIIMLFALLFQLLMANVIANEVIIESKDLAYGVFESDWLERSARVRRAVLMLGMGMRQRVVFTAGPFSEMSLSTFIAILRTSYSFYTLFVKH